MECLRSPFEKCMSDCAHDLRARSISRPVLGARTSSIRRLGAPATVVPSLSSAHSRAHSCRALTHTLVRVKPSSRRVVRARSLAPTFRVWPSPARTRCFCARPAITGSGSGIRSLDRTFKSVHPGGQLFLSRLMNPASIRDHP